MTIVLKGSREIVARNVLNGLREMDVTDVLMVTMATPVVRRFQLSFFLCQRRHLLYFEVSKL